MMQLVAYSAMPMTDLFAEVYFTGCPASEPGSESGFEFRARSVTLHRFRMGLPYIYIRFPEDDHNIDNQLLLGEVR
ncbi:unnamed protein product [Calypogeia fissa]